MAANIRCLDHIVATGFIKALPAEVSTAYHYKQSVAGVVGFVSIESNIQELLQYQDQHPQFNFSTYVIPYMNKLVHVVTLPLHPYSEKLNELIRKIVDVFKEKYTNQIVEFFLGQLDQLLDESVGYFNSYTHTPMDYRNDKFSPGSTAHSGKDVWRSRRAQFITEIAVAILDPELVHQQLAFCGLNQKLEKIPPDSAPCDKFFLWIKDWMQQMGSPTEEELGKYFVEKFKNSQK